MEHLKHASRPLVPTPAHERQARCGHRALNSPHPRQTHTNAHMHTKPSLESPYWPWGRGRRTSVTWQKQFWIFLIATRVSVALGAGDCADHTSPSAQRGTHAPHTREQHTGRRSTAQLGFAFEGCSTPRTRTRTNRNAEEPRAYVRSPGRSTLLLFHFPGLCCAARPALLVLCASITGNLAPIVADNLAPILAGNPNFAGDVALIFEGDLARFSRKPSVTSMRHRCDSCAAHKRTRMPCEAHTPTDVLSYDLLRSVPTLAPHATTNAIPPNL
eukprot:3574890-Pleurochrysis_carterae.AAC.3